ncbi:MAG: hypothetical protein ACI4Q4_08720 [Oscillospiraceae bacterium]
MSQVNATNETKEEVVVNNEEIIMRGRLYSSIKPNEASCFTIMAIVLWVLSAIVVIVALLIGVSPELLVMIVSISIMTAILGVFLFAFGKMIKVQTAILYKLSSVLKEIKSSNK